MKNEEYIAAVEKEQYPFIPTVQIASEFKNKNGVIKNLLYTTINSIAVIESVAGSVRSQHYHKKSNHFLYIISGQVEYFERDLDGSNVFNKIYNPGEMIFTGPLRIHKTVSLTDSIMISMSNHSKRHEDHENDLVRMDF